MAGLNRTRYHLRGGKKHVIIFLLVLGGSLAAKVEAQNVTLAMAVTPATAVTFKPTRSLSKPVADPATPAPTRATTATAFNAAATPPALRLERSGNPGGDSLVIARTNLRIENKLDSVNVRAGFGHPSDNALAAQTEFQLANRNSPGIAYLNASFSF